MSNHVQRRKAQADYHLHEGDAADLDAANTSVCPLTVKGSIEHVGSDIEYGGAITSEETGIGVFYSSEERMTSNALW